MCVYIYRERERVRDILSRLGRRPPSLPWRRRARRPPKQGRRRLLAQHRRPCIADVRRLI